MTYTLDGWCFASETFGRAVGEVSVASIVHRRQPGKPPCLAKSVPAKKDQKVTGVWSEPHSLGNRGLEHSEGQPASGNAAQIRSSRRPFPNLPNLALFTV